MNFFYCRWGLEMSRTIELKKLRILLIQENDGQWSAQCLDYDIVTQAARLTDLKYEFEKTLMAYIAISDSEGKEPLEGIEPAPDKFWEMWRDAQTDVLLRPPPDSRLWALADRVG